MLTRHFSRDSIKAAEGQPRVVRMVLCDNHGYLTFAGDCGCSIQHDYERFAVVGTMPPTFKCQCIRVCT